MGKTKDSRRNNFLLQGGILAIAGIVVRVIGMAYRIPITRILGEYGISLYETAYSAYSIILIVSSYSLPVAVSKMIAAKNACKEYVNAERVFRCSILYALVVGVLASAICYFCAPWLVQAEGAIPVLRILAPVILFSAVLGTFRGLFQGQGTMVPTSISQIIEQIINAVVSIVAAVLLIAPFRVEDPEGLRPIRGAMGSTMGTGAGVVAGLAFVVLVYLMFRPKLKKRVRKGQEAPIDSYGQILKMIIWTVTPMVLSATLYNVSPYIDNNLIYGVMGNLGVSEEAIGAMHGIYAGKYLQLVNIPVAFASALSSAMLPEVAAAKARGDASGILSKAQMTIKVTMLLALPCTLGLTVLGGPAAQLIYGNSTVHPDMARNLFLYGSCFVLFFSMSTVTNALLQATDNLRYPVIHSVIALVLHTVAAYVMLRMGMGVWALMWSTIVFAVVLCVLNHLVLRRKVGFRMDWVGSIWKPLLISGIMGIVCWCSYYIIHYLTKSNTIGFLVAFVLGVITYAIALPLFNGVTEEELIRIPKGQVIVRVLKKVGLLGSQEEE